MSAKTACLLTAAILDNTLNLKSTNTSSEDKRVYEELCRIANISEEWRSRYFSEVQAGIEADLEKALLGDVKYVQNVGIIPDNIGQLTVWDPKKILGYLPEICRLFSKRYDSWMLNLIDIRDHCSYFVCDDICYQRSIESVFNVRFISGVAKTAKPFLRKEIIKLVRNESIKAF